MSSGRSTGRRLSGIADGRADSSYTLLFTHDKGIGLRVTVSANKGKNRRNILFKKR